MDWFSLTTIRCENTNRKIACLYKNKVSGETKTVTFLRKKKKNWILILFRSAFSSTYFASSIKKCEKKQNIKFERTANMLGEYRMAPGNRSWPNISNEKNSMLHIDAVGHSTCKHLSDGYSREIFDGKNTCWKSWSTLMCVNFRLKEENFFNFFILLRI